MEKIVKNKNTNYRLITISFVMYCVSVETNGLFLKFSILLLFILSIMNGFEKLKKYIITETTLLYLCLFCELIFTNLIKLLDTGLFMTIFILITLIFINRYFMEKKNENCNIAVNV